MVDNAAMQEKVDEALGIRFSSVAQQKEGWPSHAQRGVNHSIMIAKPNAPFSKKSGPALLPSTKNSQRYDQKAEQSIILLLLSHTSKRARPNSI